MTINRSEVALDFAFLARRPTARNVSRQQINTAYPQTFGVTMDAAPAQTERIAAILYMRRSANFQWKHENIQRTILQAFFIFLAEPATLS